MSQMIRIWADRPIRNGLAAVGLIAAAVAASRFPSATVEMAVFVVESLITIAPIVLPGIVLAAWITASGAGGRISAAFDGSPVRAVLFASAVGAITPVCGVTVLPLMAGLLAAGVPLAPVMAFWLSSPITDPAMLATTAATLGLDFAIGKTVAAFGLGLFGGFATAALRRGDWVDRPLRSNALVGRLGAGCGSAGEVEMAVWRSAERRAVFRREALSILRLILICLTPAFAAEYVLNALLTPDALAVYVGAGTWWGVPFAVLVGAPAYLDGYAALPLTRSLMEHGMGAGAAMAFLVAGGVVSIWGALAIVPVLRVKPFLLYLGLAVFGSMLAGWAFGAAVAS